MIKINLKKKKINEITDEESARISEVPVGEQFPNIFGDKQRIVFESGELENAKQVGKSYINKVEEAASETLLKSLERFINYISVKDGENKYIYGINYPSASITRIYDKIIEAGPKKGEKIQRVEKIKISKLQEILDKCIKSFREASANVGMTTQKLYPEFEKDIRKIFPVTNPLYNEYMSNPEEFLMHILNSSKTDLDFIYSRKVYANIAKKPMDVLVDSLGVISQLAGDYVIVVSRAPIDVARMSDFPGIESCHSPPRPKKDKHGKIIPNRFGGDKFDCAIQDSKSNGAVALLVPRKAVEDNQQNLQSREFYKDLERKGVEGPTPLQRIRLRRYMHIPTEIEILVPEIQIYGGYPSAPFLKKLKEIMREQQQSEVAKIKGSLKSFNEFVLIGGSWSDTPSKTLLSIFLEINPKEPKADEKDNDNYDDETDTSDSMDDARISELLLDKDEFIREVINISNLSEDAKVSVLENTTINETRSLGKVNYVLKYTLEEIQPDKKIVTSTKQHAGVLQVAARDSINNAIKDNVKITELKFDIRYPHYHAIHNKLSSVIELSCSFPENGMFTKKDMQQVFEMAKLFEYLASDEKKFERDFEKKLKIEVEKFFNVKEQKAKYFNYYLRG